MPSSAAGRPATLQPPRAIARGHPSRLTASPRPFGDWAAAAPFMSSSVKAPHRCGGAIGSFAIAFFEKPTTQVQELSYNADMIDKAAIFTAFTRRNAIRRQAQLPLLDTRDEFDRAVEF